jgi:propanol-preferring alcohol dehydrogenase
MLLEHPAPASRGPLRVADLPDPEPAAGEIVLDVAACAVCRTDLQIAEGDLAARRLPIVPGHQVVGRVRAIGAGVQGWGVGDRAGIGWLGGACGACAFCRTGRENLCREARFTGWDRDGGFAERVTVRAGFALRLPDGVADIDAAPLLCGGIIGYRSLKLSGITPGGRLGLFGFGASALLAIQIARHWGCEVFVWTRSPVERERATALGAAWVGGYDDPAPAPLDAAVTFAPVGDIVVTALRAVDPGATVAVNAIHLDRMPEFSYDLLWGERVIRSVANFTRADAEEFLALAVEARVRSAVECHPLDGANDALARIADGRVDGAAVLDVSIPLRAAPPIAGVAR